MIVSRPSRGLEMNTSRIEYSERILRVSMNTYTVAHEPHAPRSILFKVRGTMNTLTNTHMCARIYYLYKGFK